MRASRTKGIALITVLIMLSMMSGLTLLLLMNLLEDVRSSAVLEVNTRLFYAADSGIEEARTRLLYGSSSQMSSLPSTPTADWAGYIRKDSSTNVLGLDPAYDGYGSTSLETALGTPPFELVKIFYNTEANKNRDIDGVSGLDATTVVYLGDDGAGGLARNLTGTGSPIRTVQSYATVDGRRALLESEIVSAFVVLPDVEAVIRNNGEATFNGSFSVDREDGGSTLPGVKTGDSSPDSYSGTIFPPTTPDEVEDSASPDYDVDSYISAAADVFTPITDLATPTNTSDTLYRYNAFSEGADTSPELIYSDRSVTINGNGASTYAILVVNGDVDLSSLAFYGLIIASGDLTFSGGGSVHNIYGAAIADGDLTLGGSFDLSLDLDRISNYLQSIRTKVITFREVRK